MSDKTYETHLLSSQPLPFIFHLDTIINDSATTGRENWHTNLELLYFIEGSGSVICDAQEFAVKKNDIFIVNSNMPHCVTSSTLIRYHCLIIDDDFCVANSINTENISFKPIITDSYATALFDDVVEEYNTFNSYKNAGIKSAILKLMVYLARNYTESHAYPQKSISKKTENIKIAIGFIKSHFNQKLALEDIAYQAGLSKYYFLREFKALTGYTPIAYINKIRCENAKKMLLAGGYEIKEICEKTGFDNLSYFSKKFKEYEGYTPSEYIKKHL